ncbi:hypothetical protein GCM10007160_19680 [Litchfieldella qijiaojingensis]|uniref:Uncharacterized protein n=1 Tax=Litchfieldella qijiaojingensis TaxID=980347 RepID=A0ABQ2YQP6_9GAMM|nr:hypothetical protein GCM10007160_19680 [Halomonas qijiaojingensis]
MTKGVLRESASTHPTHEIVLDVGAPVSLAGGFQIIEAVTHDISGRWQLIRRSGRGEVEWDKTPPPDSLRRYTPAKAPCPGTLTRIRFHGIGAAVRLANCAISAGFTGTPSSECGQSR